MEHRGEPLVSGAFRDKKQRIQRSECRAQQQSGSLTTPIRKPDPGLSSSRNRETSASETNLRGGPIRHRPIRTSWEGKGGGLEGGRGTFLQKGPPSPLQSFYFASASSIHRFSGVSISLRMAARASALSASKRVTRTGWVLDARTSPQPWGKFTRAPSSSMVS